jgi:hypothetical protein
MKRWLISAVAVASGLALALPAAAQQVDNPLVGSWKTVSFKQKSVKDGTVIDAQGADPQARIIYSASGRYTSISTRSDRKVAGQDMTDAERLELFKTMFALSGSYTVEGNKLHSAIDIAWRADWVGRKNTQTFKIEGDTLHLESAPFRNVRGEDVVAITVLQREKK